MFIMFYASQSMFNHRMSHVFIFRDQIILDDSFFIDFFVFSTGIQLGKKVEFEKN